MRGETPPLPILLYSWVLPRRPKVCGGGRWAAGEILSDDKPTQHAKQKAGIHRCDLFQKVPNWEKMRLMLKNLVGRWWKRPNIIHVSANIVFAIYMWFDRATINKDSEEDEEEIRDEKKWCGKKPLLAFFEDPRRNIPKSSRKKIVPLFSSGLTLFTLKRKKENQHTQEFPRRNLRREKEECQNPPFPPNW